MKQILSLETGEIIEYENDEYIAKKNAALALWEETSKKVKELAIIAKAAQAEYIELVADPRKTKGTQYDDLGNGWRCKITKSPNYSFKKGEDQKVDINAISVALSQIADTIENGSLIAGSLVRWTPDLSLSTYNELSPEAKAIIDTVAIEGKSYTKLEIVPPKEKK